jgi:hypothetical protein
MPPRTYTKRETRLLDALFNLLSVSTRLLAEEAAWARGRRAPPAVQERLDRAERSLLALSLVAEIINTQPWREERPAIRGERLQNPARRYA